MRRRALISTLSAVGLAGCNAIGGSPDRTTRPPLGVETEPPTPTRTAIADPTGDPTPAARTRVGPTRTLVSLRPRNVPDGLAVRTGFLGGATRERPFLLWVGVENRSDTETTLDLGGTPPVSTYRLRPEDGDQPLYLVPVEMDETTAGLRLWNSCWKTRDRGVVEEPETTRTVTVPPGEMVGRPYALATMRGAGVCLPVGQYVVAGDGDWSVGLSVFTEAGRDQLSSQFAPDDLPQLSFPGSEGTSWYHELAGDDPAVYAGPNDEQVGLNGGDFRLTLYNYGHGPVDLRREWRLYRQHADGWRLVAPFDDADPGVETVRPGETGTVALRLWNSPRLDVDPPTTVGGLRPGRYAVALVRASVWRGATRQRVVSLAAAVDLVGNPPTLSPSSAVSETARDGATLEVDTGTRDPWFVSVERLADAPDATLLLEQVLQFQVLRDSLSYLHDDDDLDEVALGTSRERVRRFFRAAARLGVDDGEGTVRFAFGGTGYRVDVGAS
ncbi:hypothetical protein [Haloarchaeobius sp. HRN-SO-5]|uniref:hypothetical protein n=1 Tax=Haloarchaeobius sp. HRN-SO-5 TaxID=3446118 RepID=UPI003EB8CDA5